MSNCKRMTVRSLALTMKNHLDFHVSTATNYNTGECSNVPGKCGCIHSEQALLESHPFPDLVYLTHSPCMSCAKLLHKHGVRLVIYKDHYRSLDGLDFLHNNDVRTVYLP